MKKYILSLLVAVGLIGSGNTQVITITDNTSGCYQTFNSSHFNNDVEILNFGINKGDNMTINYQLNESPPSYASTTTDVSSGGQGSVGSMTVSSVNSGQINFGVSTFTLGFSYAGISTTYNFVSPSLISYSMPLNFTASMEYQHFSGGYQTYLGQYNIPYREYGSTFVHSYWTESLTVIPEPSTYALFGIGAIGMLMVMRRKKTV